MRDFFLFIILCWCLATVACAARAAKPIGIPMRTTTRFEAEWRDYQKYPSEKAFAVAGNLNGLYVSGVAFGYPSKESAKAEALYRCELRRADRRIASACHLYAVGDTVEARAISVQEAEDGNAPLNRAIDAILEKADHLRYFPQ